MRNIISSLKIWDRKNDPIGIDRRIIEPIAQRVEAVIEKARMLEFHVDADAVESVYRAMVSGFTRLELAKHKKASDNLK
jgi:hypothetical protein